MIRDSRATLSFVFGLVGGILIVVGASVYLPIIYGYGYSGLFVFGFFGILMAIVSGTIVIVGAALAFQRPNQGVTWGILSIVFGALSFFGSGGFLIGMVLAITGGALAVAVGASGPVASASGQRACLSCGMLVAREFVHCPHCGRAMGQLPG